MMSTENRFQPPRAGVADVRERAEQYQPVRFWSPRGRVSRLQYLGYLMGGYLLVILTAAVLGGVMGAMGAAKAAPLAFLLPIIPYTVFSIIMLIQRSHDMGWSGWSSLLAFIPFAALVWIFKAGTPGENRFGAPPPPNTTKVKILALLMPIIALVGMLAAIALPAYKGYTDRAKAAQLQQQQLQQQVQPQQ
jgi:uncharacterized membrane protein YhaH (DUF805 family)